jgi:hypothetical protein
MNFENPTPLRVGATGVLDGWRVRVAGRVVMGMEERGETYYWQEFNLVDGFGRSATLVLEDTDDGPEWKLFKPFEPIRALTAVDAARKRVGDTVNLDGTDARITLIDQSRVYHIEGTAPEGVEVGDVANYFNVDTGERMLVASWTGDEIEFYEGHDVPAEKVAAAFGFATTPSSTSPVSFQRTGAASSNAAVKYVGVVLAAVIIFSAYSCVRGRKSAPPLAGPPPKQAAPASRIMNGARGRIAQREYLVTHHGLIEIARVSGRHDRHEYFLSASGGEPALLVDGLTGNSKEWHLFQPLAAAEIVPTRDPFEAATRRKGAPVRIGERTLQVTDLFQSKTLSSDGTDGGAPWPALQYGFLANQGGEWLIARWNESGIHYHLGRSIPEAEVLAALKPTPEKTR